LARETHYEQEFSVDFVIKAKEHLKSSFFNFWPKVWREANKKREMNERRWMREGEERRKWSRERDGGWIRKIRGEIREKEVK
jgi:hypothetical protein